MSDMISNARAVMVLHRLAIAKCTIFVFGTLFGAILTALSGMEWSESTTQTKVMVGLGIGVSFCSTLGAFLDQSFKRAQEGADPITGLPFSRPPFATQAQVDAGLSEKTIVSPATLAHLPAVKAADEQLPKT